jgi:hypothetical protein
MTENMGSNNWEESDTGRGKDQEVFAEIQRKVQGSPAFALQAMAGRRFIVEKTVRRLEGQTDGLAF